MISKITEGDYACGRGPVVTYAPAVHNKLLNLIIDVAEELDIPLQKDAASRATGTDTDAFAYANGGVPSALISLALRYMHTTVESVDKEDVENVIKLLYATLKQLHPDFNFKYIA
jgi:putative aminopeptidase FrvX